MAWFRVDDGFWRHRKVRRLGTDRVTTTARVAAVGLWTLAGDWSADTGSDGFVPAEQIETWDPKHAIARRLVAVGLWHEDEVDGEPGYRFHQWDTQQPTAEEVQERRRRRQEAGRLGGLRSGQSRRSKPEASASASASAHAYHDASSKTEPRPGPARPGPLLADDETGGAAVGSRATTDPPPPGRPRCQRHAHLPDHDPGPACVGCRDARLAAERQAAPALAAVPDWCGECEPSTRQVELADGRVARCPRCHPLRSTG